MKRILTLSVLLFLTIIIFATSLATEVEPFEPPIDLDEYSLTSSITASLGISGGVASCSGEVSAINYGSSCSITARLQKKQTNGTWKTIKTWSSSGTNHAYAGGTYTVSSGSYRVKATATITYNGESETVTKYTGIKTY